ncbi:hypothetical protein [Cohnella nanjingensis]|nr:hypothetical protein [Cohnella nanjingensis]
MKIKIKKAVQLILILFISAGLSWFICTFNTKLDKISILNDDIIINLLCGLLALSIAVITLIYTLLEKIKEKMPDNSNIDKIINRLFGTLKKDTWAVFVFLIIVVLVIFFRDTDIPNLQWSNTFPFSKLNFVYFTKLFVIFLSLSAVADIILTLFSLLTALSKSAK